MCACVCTRACVSVHTCLHGCFLSLFTWLPLSQLTDNLTARFPSDLDFLFYLSLVCASPFSGLHPSTGNMEHFSEFQGSPEEEEPRKKLACMIVKCHLKTLEERLWSMANAKCI